MKILDIDLDFFLNRKAHTIIPVTSTTRLDEKDYSRWSIQSTINFLEDRCGLSTDKKIPGKIFTHHDEVFFFLKELQQQNDFTLQFSIDHIDAHADLGNGDSSYQYLATDILQRPVRERDEIEIRNGYLGLSAGNYLVFAIACRWLKALRYINREGWYNDQGRFHFRNFDPESNVIELKKFSEGQIEQMINFGDFFAKAITIPPLGLEPAVPFEKLDFNDFVSDGNYDFILLTQSPGFTPATADELIPIISNYISLL